MFGSVLVRFQSYMTDKLGPNGWKDLLINAGLPQDKNYHTIRYYPDAEFNKLLSVAAQKTNLPRDFLYRKLGKDFGNYLLKTYRTLFLPSWRTLDVIEKVAPKVFKISYMIDLKAPKSEVKCERISPNEVVVYYYSPRKMCPYILGIIDAVSEHFKERVLISHEKCMLNGAFMCEINVKLCK